jgi:hypothetical protein
MVFWIAMLCGLARVANRKTTNDIFTSTRTWNLISAIYGPPLEWKTKTDTHRK